MIRREKILDSAGIRLCIAERRGGLSAHGGMCSPMRFGVFELPLPKESETGVQNEAAKHPRDQQVPPNRVTKEAASFIEL
jgi:hypothetical protein